MFETSDRVAQSSSADRTPLLFGMPETSPGDLALKAFLQSRTSAELLSKEDLGPERVAASLLLRGSHQQSPAGTDPLKDPAAGWLADAYVLDIHRTVHVTELLTISAVHHPDGPRWFDRGRPRLVAALSLIVRTNVNANGRSDVGRAAERSRANMLERIARAIEQHMPILDYMLPWLRNPTDPRPHFDRIAQPDGVTEDVFAVRFDARARHWYTAREINEQSFRRFIGTLLDRSE